MPQVSVIIPNYNHSKYLAKRIDSVLNQSFQDFEVIIMDDRSSDRSRDVIELYRGHPKVTQILYNEQNSGSTFRQWNKGVQMAGCELIWIAESDDVAHPDLLQKLVTPFNKDKSLAISYCQSYKLDSEDNVTGDWSDWTSDFGSRLFDADFVFEGKAFISQYLLTRNVLPNASAIVFKKSAFNAVGMTDVDIKYCSDWLLWIKMLSIGNVSFCSEKLNYFRFHNKSVIATANTKVLFMNKFDILMRMRAQRFFRRQPRAEVREIYAKNRELISNQAVHEAIYFLKFRKFPDGLRFFRIALLNATNKRKIIGKMIDFLGNSSIKKMRLFNT